MNKVRFMYLRDWVRHPVGCLAIVVDRDAQVAKYGLSVRNPLDAVDRRGRSVAFNRALSKELALTRLLESPREVSIAGSVSQHTTTRAIMQDIIDCDSSPTRAVKYAKMWLREVAEYEEELARLMQVIGSHRSSTPHDAHGTHTIYYGGKP